MSTPPSPNFVKKPGNRFCGVVCTDHEVAELTGNRILDDHSFARLDVAADEVA